MKKGPIYENKSKGGGPGEFSPFGLTIWKGCPHGCLYCYGPGTLHMKPKVYRTTTPQPIKDLLKRLEKQVASMSNSEKMMEVVCSYLGDPYAVPNTNGLTRDVLTVLGDAGVHFSVLTKAGTKAKRDFDLLIKYDGGFGQTITFNKQATASQWEPNAAPISDRIRALKLARQRGIRTWVSLEPVFYPKETLDLIRRIYKWVDHWKCGPLNHEGKINTQLAKWGYVIRCPRYTDDEKRATRDRIRKLMGQLGYKETNTVGFEGNTFRLKREYTLL